MSDPSMYPRAIHVVPDAPILVSRRPPNDTAPAFSEADGEAILVRLRDAVAAGASELGPILTAITETARLLSGASGVALALRCDGMVVCKARSGEPSPEVGVYLDEESGISGQCLRTGEILRCDEALTDFRVNPVVCRTLGLRSIAIVPIRRGTETTGILEAFSTRPHAFTETHIIFLSRLADLAEAAQSQEQARAKQAKRELSTPPPAPKAAEAIVAAVAAEEPGLASLQPAQARPGVHYDAMMNRLRSQLSEGRALGKLYEPARRRLPLLGGVVGLLVLVLIAWNLFGGASSSSSSHHSASASTPTEEQITLSQAPPSAEVLAAARPSAEIAERSARRSSQDARDGVRESPRSRRTERSTVPDVVTHAAKKSSHSTASEEPADAPAAASQTESSAFADQPREQVQFQPVKAEPARIESARLEPAKIEISSGGGAVLGDLLSTRSAVPRLGPQVSGGVSGGVLEHRVQPFYPRFALERKLEGAVVLEATVADNGNVQSVRVVSGQSILAQAAVDAVKQWRYRPTLLNGKPVSMQTLVTINFKAPK